MTSFCSQVVSLVRTRKSDIRLPSTASLCVCACRVTEMCDPNSIEKLDYSDIKSDAHGDRETADR